MLKAKLSELVCEVELRVTGPLLIKSDKSKDDWTDQEREEYRKENQQGDPPDMVWVRINGHTGHPFIPGSSIKGILRSQAEKCARAQAPVFGCCNPFTEISEPQVEWEASCSQKFHKRERSGEHIGGVQAYGDACPICKLFGCSKLASRLLIDDAYLVNNQWSREVRDSIAIDRFTGGANPGAKFNMELMVGGTFTTHIYLRNFERWQVGVLACLLQDLQAAHLRFGYGKRRGWGKVNGTVKDIKLTYFGAIPQGCSNTNPIVAGIGSLIRSASGDWSGYRFADPAVAPIDGALSQSFSIPMDLSAQPWIDLAQCWMQYLADYRLPDEMKQDYILREVPDNG